MSKDLQAQIQAIFDEMYATFERTGDFDEATATIAIQALIEQEVAEQVRLGRIDELQNCMASSYLEDIGKVGQVKGYCAERLAQLKNRIKETK